MMDAKDKIKMTSADKVSGVSYVKEGTNLCRLPNGLICVGCCGFDFAKDLSNKKPFIEAMVQSTGEYSLYKDTLSFKKRCEYYDLHECGLCKHLILKSVPITGEIIDELVKQDKIDVTCALHPSENTGEEFREGECDLNFMCETQKMFLDEWGDWTKQRFLNFLETKDLDWFSYSKGMHDNSIVKEFFDKGLITNYDK